MKKGKVVVIVIIAILVIATIAGNGTEDKDPSHYDYYKCTHCNGTGRQYGAECKWCNGTGYSVSQKDEYRQSNYLSEGQATLVAFAISIGIILFIISSIKKKALGSESASSNPTVKPPTPQSTYVSSKAIKQQKMEKLNQLYQQGIITEEEYFAAIKKVEDRK